MENAKLYTKLYYKQQQLNLDFDKMILEKEFIEYKEEKGKFYITRLVNKDKVLFNLGKEIIDKGKLICYNIRTIREQTEKKEDLYREFRIPKRKGGYRYLIEPREDLKLLQKEMLNYLQEDLNIQVHHCAHAFIKNKDAYTNAKQHKDNKCFITLDLKDFFPSITEEILEKELRRNAKLYDLDKKTKDFIKELVWLSTYKGALPQGSPLSPFLSNIVMHIFDYTLSYRMFHKKIDRYTYTRYADDMCFSAKAFGHVKTFLNQIEELLNELYNGSIKINKEKTKLLKNTNRCYITGIKINKDNNTTYGHENKKKLKLELFNLFQGLSAGTLTKEEAQEVLGRYSYMARIEPNYAKYLERKLLKDFKSKECTIHKHFKEILK